MLDTHKGRQLTVLKGDTALMRRALANMSGSFVPAESTYKIQETNDHIWMVEGT